MTAQAGMLQPDLVGHMRSLQVKRPRLQQLESLVVQRPFDFDRRADHVFRAPQQAANLEHLRGMQTRLRGERGRNGFSRGRTPMRTRDRVIFLPDGGAKQCSVEIELEPIGRHFTLRDRGAEPPRRADQPFAVGRPAEAAA